MELRTYRGSDNKFYRIRIFVLVDKPLQRFLRAGPSIRDEYRGLFKYEHLHCLCFNVDVLDIFSGNAGSSYLSRSRIGTCMGHGCRLI